MENEKNIQLRNYWGKMDECLRLRKLEPTTKVLMRRSARFRRQIPVITQRDVLSATTILIRVRVTSVVVQKSLRICPQKWEITTGSNGVCPHPPEMVKAIALEGSLGKQYNLQFLDQGLRNRNGDATQSNQKRKVLLLPSSGF